MMDDDVSDEIEERQLAEIEFLSAAYTPEEAWSSGNTGTSSFERQIHRMLNLPSQLDRLDGFIPLELVLRMPLRYPIDEKYPMTVDASLPSHSCLQAEKANESVITTSAMQLVRKLAFDMLPHLLTVCRASAKEMAGQEALFTVLSTADEWIHDDWTNAMQRLKSNNVTSGGATERSAQTQNSILLERKLIYSHHLMSKSKRRDILSLAKELRLGGYSKIGWPGIIIIEGRADSNSCQLFLSEMKSMRWQYLTVRGEEEENIMLQDGQDWKDVTKFKNKFEELGEDQMSHLASLCRVVGLESLFLTSMKIYNTSVDEDSKNLKEVIEHDDYAALVHVDHMNDENKYHKWLDKTCKMTGCSFFRKKIYLNDDCKSCKPIIIVAIWSRGEGSKIAVKQALKRWRTSKVDVDSRKKPCLERMMSVLSETVCESFVPEAVGNSCFENDVETLSIKDMTAKVASIGGRIWEEEFISFIENFGH